MIVKKALLAVLLAVGSLSVQAAPALQKCAPIEISHTDLSGLSYHLACDAGKWHLGYTGSVPAGEDAVNAQYRLSIDGPDGVSMVQNRVVRLPAPARLAQMLMREAVVLDSGELALRDCKEIGCTLYRPMVESKSLIKATVTVTPESKRLMDEGAALKADIEQLKVELSSARMERDTAQRELRKTQDALNQMSAELTGYRLEADSIKQVKSSASQEELQARIRQLEDEVASAKSAEVRAMHTVVEVMQANRTLTQRLRELDSPPADTKKVSPIPDAMKSEDVRGKDDDSNTPNYMLPYEPCHNVMEEGQSGLHIKDPGKQDFTALVSPGTHHQLDKKTRPAHRFARVKGQWYDVWTDPPTPIAPPAKLHRNS
ncbi:membrane assembly protein AsmA [Novimethylophilus kurashikiensis]|uniref:Membrane assembly protein AsmA n=1 Tax=Novimethylophilus kurashikiensis TaxID=1825523 RepID=A0A2R5F8L5_9PROT|nr:hypothetical protein [Novimethylophilus kurashikiensis]GBG14375.1 membrane assembly protein AsmA [Novimethylophilus kurashikiensis]